MGKQTGGSSNEPQITEEHLSSPVENESELVPVETKMDPTPLESDKESNAQSDLSGSSFTSDSEFENHSSGESSNVNECEQVEKKRKRKWKKKKKKRVQKPNSEKFKSNHDSSVPDVSDRVLRSKRPNFWKKKKRDSVDYASVPSFSSFSDFSSFSKKNNLKFSNKHGFEFSFGVNSERPKRPPVWKEKKMDSVDHASVPSFSSFSDFSSFSKNNDLHLSNNHARGFSFGCSKLRSYSIKEMLGFNTGVNSESLKDRMFDPSEYQKLLCESTRFYAKQCFYSSRLFDCGKGVNGTNMKGPIFKWVPKSL